ncbi:hypothetical protein ACH5RR_008042 [Cinchona calisaya]|uniref:RNase H type-1 domain-containing protein n=1 Tax=Cinchona calisaya TaxID=153742 RepID=A0ABD3AE42_9GENT
MLLGWEFPRQGWVKLNVDESATGCPDPVGGGGLLRNDQGLWIFGFAMNIGELTSLVAELWAIWKGLQISWDLNFKHLEIESNSILGVQIIQEAAEDHQHYNLINYMLAKMSLGLNLGVTLLPDPSNIVKSADMIGATCKRYVTLS